MIVEILVLFFATFVFLSLLYKDDAIGVIKLDPRIPKAGHLPIIGSLWALLKSRDFTNDWVSDQSIHFGDGKPFAFSAPFGPPFIVCNDPKAVEYALKTNFENFVKGDFFSGNVVDFLGHGIFNADGDQWKTQRKTAANIFNVSNFRNFVKVVWVEELGMLVKVLDRAAADGKIIDLQDYFFRFTLDGFCKIAYNHDLKSMDAEKTIPFALAFDAAQSVLEWRFMFPLWRIEEWITPKGKRMQGYVQTMREFSRALIHQRREESTRASQEGLDVKARHDLLTLFQDLKTDDGEPLYSQEQLTDLVINFIIAGRDTTAQALSWSIYNLCQHPECEKNLLEEINNQKEELSYESVKSMKYANAVFHEALRLYPSVPKNTKTVLKDDVLPDGTPLPAGSQFAWSTYAQGRMKSIWGEDASQFRPERWITGNAASKSQFEYAVFNAGPRICLGKSMAELEGVFVLVSTLQRFKFTLVNPKEVTYTTSLTLPMKNGLRVKVERR